MPSRSVGSNCTPRGPDPWDAPAGDGARVTGGPAEGVSWRGAIINHHPQPLTNMLYTLALILIVAWLLGLVSSYTMGGFIHVLLVVALVVLLVRVIQGKRIS